jgi:hypothetical protein
VANFGEALNGCAECGVKVLTLHILWRMEKVLEYLNRR